MINEEPVNPNTSVLGYKGFFVFALAHLRSTELKARRDGFAGVSRQAYNQNRCSVR